MYPGHWAAVTPTKPALVVASTGETVSYAALDERSTRLAWAYRAAGLRPGDHVAVFMENHPRYMEVVWAALRAGLVLTPVNRYLTADEAGYIVDDCDARALVTSRKLADVASALPSLAPACRLWLMVDDAIEGYESYERALGSQAYKGLPEEPRGELMLYSSGTTGRPKGIARAPQGGSVADGSPFNSILVQLFGMNETAVYLSPAPLYHAAPLGFCTATQSLGGTVVMMESFDAMGALSAIERYHVTHSQWVPTMFRRMLDLPAAQRSEVDLSSHRVAIHAAAPCARPLKEAMITWWGPILHEYYGGSEFNGMTYASPQDWLAHPGSVGRPIIGALHICDEDGDELPSGEVGTIYFELPERPFHYHNDRDGTRAAEHRQHKNWTTLGDIGFVTDDGFLYLTDRRSFMIVSGGVNIYPQEVEDCLLIHPKVEDAAVFGIPNQDMGEEVKAVVQPRADVVADHDLAVELIAHTRTHLAHYKCPRSIDFEANLPRLPTGKLYKRQLRDPYWVGRDTRIV